MTVLGLDLSIRSTGFAPAVSTIQPYALTFGTGKCDPKGDERLARIHAEIIKHLADEPELVVVESLPPYGTASASLGLVHGVARLAFAQHGVPFIYISPSALKKWATGSGRADKDAMIAVFREICPSSNLCRKITSDMADAYFLRQIGLKYLGLDYKPGYGDDEYDVLAYVKKG